MVSNVCIGLLCDGVKREVASKNRHMAPFHVRGQWGTTFFAWILNPIYLPASHFFGKMRLALLPVLEKHAQQIPYRDRRWDPTSDHINILTSPHPPPPKKKKKIHYCWNFCSYLFTQISSELFTLGKFEGKHAHSPLPPPLPRLIHMPMWHG